MEDTPETERQPYSKQRFNSGQKPSHPTLGPVIDRKGITEYLTPRCCRNAVLLQSGLKIR